MIQSKILGEAVGIQYQGEKDLSETNLSDSLTRATIVGRFKRGFMGRPFRVTRDNYQALLGFDSSNPDYLAVEDAFSRGVPEITILRIGSSISGDSNNPKPIGNSGNNDSSSANTIANGGSTGKPSYIDFRG